MATAMSMSTAPVPAPAPAADGRRSTKLVAALSRTSAAFLFFSVVVVGVVVSARWISTTTTLQTSLFTTAAISAAGRKFFGGGLYGEAPLPHHPTTSPLPCTIEMDGDAEGPSPRPHSLGFISPATAAVHRQTKPPPRPPSTPPSPPPPLTYSISCPTPPLRLNISHAAKTRKTSQTLALALSSSSSCRSSDPPPATITTPSSNSSCPSHFRFIHEDLRPWRASGGITRAMLARARVTASFRLVVLSGRTFVQRFRLAFQTRDLFTIWGVLQLLRRYLDLMFDCVDWPVVRTHLYRGEHAPFMPPLFRYCGDDRTLDIVFPDWSFWGWPEINIKPWDAMQKDLKDGNNRVRWSDREPYAYWKGNPAVAVTRQELVRCNVSSTQDWNARIYMQDWFKESKAGYKNSDLGTQCTHRSLMPIQHYWPVRDDNKCGSIKYAVDWGNSHKQLAQRIEKQASNFIQEEVNMDHVYDYMHHLLTEYAKLLRFKASSQ